MMELENTMLSKIIQAQKDKYHIFAHMQNIVLRNNDNMTIAKAGLLWTGTKGTGRGKKG
jgi:hypothetical protein